MKFTAIIEIENDFLRMDTIKGKLEDVIEYDLGLVARLVEIYETATDPEDD